MPGAYLWAWDDSASAWKKVLVDTDGKLRISDADPFEITQTTPEDLRHVPHGYYAGGPSYKPLAVSSAGKLQVEMAGYQEGAKVYHDADQAIPDAAWTYLNFNSEHYDTDTMHDPATNNSRLTCRTAGKYLVSIQINWYPNATGNRTVRPMKNHSTTMLFYRLVNLKSTDLFQNPSYIVDLAMGDYLEVQVHQDSGGHLNVRRKAEYSPVFAAQRIGE